MEITQGLTAAAIKLWDVQGKWRSTVGGRRVVLPFGLVQDRGAVVGALCFRAGVTAKTICIPGIYLLGRTARDIGSTPQAPASSPTQWPCAKPTGSGQRAVDEEQCHRKDENETFRFVS